MRRGLRPHPVSPWSSAPTGDRVGAVPKPPACGGPKGRRPGIKVRSAPRKRRQKARRPQFSGLAPQSRATYRPERQGPRVQEGSNAGSWAERSPVSVHTSHCCAQTGRGGPGQHRPARGHPGAPRRRQAPSFGNPRRPPKKPLEASGKPSKHQELEKTENCSLSEAPQAAPPAPQGGSPTSPCASGHGESPGGGRRQAGHKRIYREETGDEQPLAPRGRLLLGWEGPWCRLWLPREHPAGPSPPEPQRDPQGICTAEPTWARPAGRSKVQLQRGLLGAGQRRAAPTPLAGAPGTPAVTWSLEAPTAVWPPPPARASQLLGGRRMNGACGSPSRLAQSHRNYPESAACAKSPTRTQTHARAERRKSPQTWQMRG